MNINKGLCMTMMLCIIARIGAADCIDKGVVTVYSEDVQAKHNNYKWHIDGEQLGAANATCWKGSRTGCGGVCESSKEHENYCNRTNTNFVGKIRVDCPKVDQRKRTYTLYNCSGGGIVGSGIDEGCW